MKLATGVSTMSFYSLIVMRYMLEHEVHIFGNELAMKFDITSGTIYPMLQRWEKRGWVTSKMERNNLSNRPDRRYYAITEKGKGIGRWALGQLQLRGN